MVEFSTSSVHDGSLSGPVMGIVDLDMALFGGEWKIFATNGADNSVSVLDANGASLSGVATTISGTNFSATDLDLVSANASNYAIFTGDGSGFHPDYELTTTGQIGLSILLLPVSGHVGQLETISTASVGGQTLVATSQEGQSGFTIQRAPYDLELFLIQNVSVPDGDIADIELISFGATGLAIAVDRADNKILSYTVAGDGTVTTADTLGVADGLGLVEPGILRIADVAGQSFGVVASGGSSSISVFEIAGDGQLTARDHVIDGQGTRFASVSELEVIEANGRAFILAAGADDGITLLELLQDGRMLHHATIEDGNATSLQNISALTGAVRDNTLHVVAASETEAGLTELTFDLGSAGLVQTGGTGDDTLTGGAGDDVLFGGHGEGVDVLLGHAGNDVLVAGHGVDRLVGGAGSDIFVFGDSHDGGQIDDFNVARDMLDLSGWFLLHDVSQLNFIAYGNRVDVGFQGYTLSVYSHDGKTLKASDVAAQIVINPSHSLVIDVPDAANLNDTHTGTGSNDVLFGSAGEDLFMFSAGSDVYLGGGDVDIVSFEDAGRRIIYDRLNAQENRGAIANDKLYSIEGITGTDFADVLKGSKKHNWFEGGAGDDVLAGRTGADTLLGGTGSDKLVGGGGADSLVGGAGNDTLVGGNGFDVLNGDAGDDLFIGGRGGDTLTGGLGKDTLEGGLGADQFHFIGGRDKIMDFLVGRDSLHIDATLLADPGMTASEVIDTYGRDAGRTVVIDFGLDADGASQAIVLRGVGDLALLEDSLFIF